MPVCVLVPVYNAAAEVGRCIDALLAHTPPSVDILIIDDASSEPGIAERLSAAAREPNVTVVRNRENLGFTRTVNRGLGLAADRDVVLLNSDTEVTPRWLTYLTAAAYARDDIGTATATSNSASQFSVPLRFHNSLPYWTNLPAYARAVAQCDRPIWIAAPFGHGFCLYVKRRYIEAVGVLDDDAFPRGYGEEVDFCLRGRRAGWRHALATKAFVYHVNAASFGASKTARKKQARVLLDRRYPEYGALLGQFSSDPALVALRRRTAATWQRLAPAAPRRLWVLGADPSRDRGALSGLPPDAGRGGFALAARGRDLRLYRLTEAAPGLADHGRIAQAPGPFAPYGQGYEELVGRWLLEHAIESIEVLGLRGHAAGLARLAADLQIPFSVRLDDAYVICPTGVLRDERGRACGGNCTPSAGDCLPRRDPLGRRLKHEHILAWQDAYRAALAQIGTLTVSSATLVEPLTAVFPELATRSIPVIGTTAKVGGQARTVAAARGHGATARIAVLCPTPGGMRDPSLHNRVLTPLTHPVLRERLCVEVIGLDEADKRELDADLVVASLAATLSAGEAKRLVARVARARVPLIVDTGCGRVRGCARRGRAGAARLLLDAAAEVWTAEDGIDAPLSHLGSRRVPVPTCVDTRLWPVDRARRRRDGTGPLRLLYRAETGRRAALGFLDDVLDRLGKRIDRPLELIVINPPLATARRPWLRPLQMPDEAAASYPILTAWLAQKGPFDLGLLPPHADRPCPLTAVLEHAAMGAISVATVDDKRSDVVGDLGPTRLVPASVTAWVGAIEELANGAGEPAGTEALTRLLSERGAAVAAAIIASRLESML
jgi:GT2 family glycosyltransferase